MLKIVKRTPPLCEPNKRPLPMGTYVALPDTGVTPKAGRDNGWAVYVLAAGSGADRLINLGSGTHRPLEGSLTEAWIVAKGGHVIPNEHVKIEVQI